MNLERNQKMKTPASSCRGRLKTLGKTLAGDANALPGASAGPRPDPHLREFRCPTPVLTWRPARQLGERLRGSMQLLGQLAKHLRGGMQIFVKTLPPHQLSSQPASVALHASSAWTRVEARRGGDRRDELPCRPR